MAAGTYPSGFGQATACAYYWIGIVLDVVSIDDARAWAFDLIALQDTPPIAIIELAMAGDRTAVLDALQSASVGADQPAAGRRLLADVLRVLQAGERAAIDAILIAMRIIRATDLPDSAYRDFEQLDELFQWTANGPDGPARELHLEVIRALEDCMGTVGGSL